MSLPPPPPLQILEACWRSTSSSASAAAYAMLRSTAAAVAVASSACAVFPSAHAAASTNTFASPTAAGASRGLRASTNATSDHPAQPASATGVSPVITHRPAFASAHTQFAAFPTATPIESSLRPRR